jgi:hypothetical protein
MTDFKKVSPEMEAQIQEAVQKGHMVYADDSLIDGFEPEICLFMQKVFDMDLGDMFISNETTLADFRGCGKHDIDDDNLEAWFDWVYGVIYSKFDIIVEGNPEIVYLAELIRNKKDIARW